MQQTAGTSNQLRREDHCDSWSLKNPLTKNSRRPPVTSPNCETSRHAFAAAPVDGEEWEVGRVITVYADPLSSSLE